MAVGRVRVASRREDREQLADLLDHVGSELGHSGTAHSVEYL